MPASTLVAGERDASAGASSPSSTLFTMASPLHTKVKTTSGTRSATIHLINSCRVSPAGRNTRELTNDATLHYLASDNACLFYQTMLACIKPFRVSVDREAQKDGKSE